MQLWIYYTLAVLVLTASPGPSSLLCMTKGVTYGWRSAAITAVGSLTAISGFIVGASNPKAIVFFSALFPQVITTNAPLMPQYLIFASTFVVMELAWLLCSAYLGAKSSNWLLAKGRAKVFNRLTGGVFIGAGAHRNPAVLETIMKNYSSSATMCLV